MSILDASITTGQSKSPLSDREAEVISLVGEALSNREIAGRLGIAEKTVKNHVAAAMRALGAKNRFDAYLIFKGITDEEAKSA